MLLDVAVDPDPSYWYPDLAAEVSDILDVYFAGGIGASLLDVANVKVIDLLAT